MPMQPVHRLLQFICLWLAVCVCSVRGNNEKAIFIAPTAIAIPDAKPNFADLNLDHLSKSRLVLQKSLAVLFPNDTHPHGLEYWYLLQDLNPGQRYEVRICWAAIQPTQFWLDVYNSTHVFDTPVLIQGVANFVETRRSSLEADFQQANTVSPTSSLLFLRVGAAADYFSSNSTLMQNPPLVNVDIILDPYLANIFPESLRPTAVYILVLVVGSWYLSGFILGYLKNTYTSKEHVD